MILAVVFRLTERYTKPLAICLGLLCSLLDLGPLCTSACAVSVKRHKESPLSIDLHVLCRPGIDRQRGLAFMVLMPLFKVFLAAGIP